MRRYIVTNDSFKNVNNNKEKETVQEKLQENPQEKLKENENNIKSLEQQIKEMDDKINKLKKEQYKKIEKNSEQKIVKCDFQDAKIKYKDQKDLKQKMQPKRQCLNEKIEKKTMPRTKKKQKQEVKRKQNLKVIRNIVLYLSCFIAFCIIVYFEYTSDYFQDVLWGDNAPIKLNSEEQEEQEKYLDENNKNVKGYLKFANSNNIFQIAKSEDNNKYYLSHNIKNETSSGGTIFFDYNNNLQTLDKNTIIYSYNMLNNDLYTQVKKLNSQEFLDNSINRYFDFSTAYEEYLGQIIYIYEDNSDNFSISMCSSDLEYNNFIDYAKQKCSFVIDGQTDLENDNQSMILTLDVCDNNTGKRLILVAKLIKK